MRENRLISLLSYFLQRQLSPTLITCTYGAGGSTQTKTLEVLDGVLARHPTVAVASHLTCVGRTTDQLREYLREAQQRGVSSIVALRGDPPQGETAFTPIANGLHYAVELVALIKQEFPGFRILVAGYPETHQEAVSPEADLEHLKEKCNAGGDTIVTQLFYDNTDFFRFRDHCSSIGITKPIIPGLMPVTNFKQIQRIATLCKAWRNFNMFSTRFTNSILFTGFERKSSVPASTARSISPSSPSAVTIKTIICRVTGSALSC